MDILKASFYDKIMIKIMLSRLWEIFLRLRFFDN